MSRIYHVAVTDGNNIPIDLLTNLNFEDALKKCLSYATTKDLEDLCANQDISIDNREKTLDGLKYVIDQHISKYGYYFYEDNSIIILVDQRNQKPLNNIRIEISGGEFLAFSKCEDTE